MKKNYLWIAALATTMLTSCIYDNENDPIAQQGQYSSDEIQITAIMSGSSEARTRAAYNLQGTTLSAWTNAGIYAYKTGTTALTDNYAFVNQQVTGSNTSYNDATNSITGTKLTIGSSLFFPYDNSDVDVYVYAPHTAVATNVTATSVSNMAITVQADQTDDADYIKSDFIYGMATADYATTKTAAVTMYHALTKLTFIVKDGTNTTPSLGTDASGITEIKLTNVYKKATIDMTAAPTSTTTAPYLTAGTQVTTDNTTQGDVVVAVKDATHTASFYSDAKTNGVSAIIPPLTTTQLTASDPDISVTIDGGTKTVKLKSSDVTELKPGYEYVFNLNIKGSELIIVAVAIKPWETQTAVDRDLDF